MSIAHHDTTGHSPIGLDRLRAAEDQQAVDAEQSPDVTSIYGADGTPDPDRLRAALELAREALPLQQANELLQIKSDDELQADIEQARRHRADLRKQADLDHALAIKLREARRDAQKIDEMDRLQHQTVMAAQERKHDQAAAEANAERRRLMNPLHELVSARTARRWLPKLAMVPAGVAAVVSAINLATQGARIVDAHNPWIGAVLGAGVDLVFTIGLISIALGRMSGAVSSFTKAETGDDDRRDWWWYTGGEVGLGLALGMASVGAHHLPSADGTAHTSELGWWFLLLPVAFGFSTLFAPRLQRSTTRRFVYAARQAELAAEYGSLNAEDLRVLRLARWLAEQERANPIDGERGDDGLPSVSAVDRAIRRAFGKSSKPLARRVIETYAILSGTAE